MRRRDLLALSAGAALLPLGAGAWAATAEGGPKRLVVVLLRGAADGLNIVVPCGEEAYYTGRPTIAIAKPGSGENAALALDEHFALHPALAPLLPLWQAKQLAFVHAAGSPDGSRSHFDAQLFMENGTPGRHSPDGWMNRLLAALPETRGPTSAIAVGPTLPQILRGKMPAANLPLGAAATTALAIDKPEVAAAFDRLYAGNEAVSGSYRQGRQARAELIGHMTSEGMGVDNGAAPNALPTLAGRLAGLIARDKNIRLAFLAVGGWDMHVRQGGADGQLANRLKPLGEGLAALAKGLGPSWDDTAVVVLSEFGRTVKENGDAGTDHGHGNVIWLLGGAVQGGRVYGEWPGLAATALYEGRDLAVTTDYRTVLASVIARHLRLPEKALAQIFPGFTPPRAALPPLIA